MTGTRDIYILPTTQKLIINSDTMSIIRVLEIRLKFLFSNLRQINRFYLPSLSKTCDISLIINLMLEIHQCSILGKWAPELNNYLNKGEQLPVPWKSIFKPIHHTNYPTLGPRRYRAQSQTKQVMQHCVHTIHMTPCWLINKNKQLMCSLQFIIISPRDTLEH